MSQRFRHRSSRAYPRVTRARRRGCDGIRAEVQVDGLVDASGAQSGLRIDRACRETSSTRPGLERRPGARARVSSLRARVSGLRASGSGLRAKQKVPCLDAGGLRAGQIRPARDAYRAGRKARVLARKAFRLAIGVNSVAIGVREGLGARPAGWNARQSGLRARLPCLRARHFHRRPALSSRRLARRRLRARRRGLRSRRFRAQGGTARAAVASAMPIPTFRPGRLPAMPCSAEPPRGIPPDAD